jgi:quinol monooxygenase YgiN
MWAQLIKARLKPGKEDELHRLEDEIQAVSQTESGWVRSFSMRDQSDPSQHYTLVVFESEAKARTFEQNPAAAAVVSKLSGVFEGPPEFVNLEVLREMAG